jgi:hypothetical protein
LTLKQSTIKAFLKFSKLAHANLYKNGSCAKFIDSYLSPFKTAAFAKHNNKSMTRPKNGTVTWKKTNANIQVITNLTVLPKTNKLMQTPMTLHYAIKWL